MCKRCETTYPSWLLSVWEVSCLGWLWVMGLLHRAEMGSAIAPSVSSLVDNCGLIEAQGTTGQIHPVFHSFSWFSPIRIFLFCFVLPGTFPGIRDLLECNVQKWIFWLCTDKHRVKYKANCTLLTATSPAWPMLDMCQRVCRLPKKLK